MPRKMKKVNKAKVTRKANKQATTVTLRKMETEFSKTPSTLAALLAKELTALKQTENKLKSAADKVNADLTKCKAQAKSLTNDKTPKGKKQLQATTKALTILTKTNSDIQKELVSIKKAIDTTFVNHAKFVTISKTLQQFEKTWKKESTQLLKPKVKKATKPAVKPVVVSTQETPIIPFNNYDNTSEASELHQDEIKEVAS